MIEKILKDIDVVRHQLTQKIMSCHDAGLERQADQYADWDQLLIECSQHIRGDAPARPEPGETSLPEFYPLALKPAQNSQVDDHEHWVLDADGGHVFCICGNRERAEGIVTILNYAASPTTQEIPADVRRLVVAARVVAFEDQGTDAIKALDQASEAFADRVRWDDEPAAPPVRSAAIAAEPVFELSEDDPTVVAVARGIAEHGFARPWNDFLPLNVHDTDQSDLVDYAKAAIAAMPAPASPEPDAVRALVRQLRDLPYRHRDAAPIAEAAAKELERLAALSRPAHGAPVPITGTDKLLARKIEDAWDIEPAPFNRADVAVRVVRDEMARKLDRVDALARNDRGSEAQ